MKHKPYGFPARLSPDREGRLVVCFPDLPDAVTDGATLGEALAEASDCLSEALAGRINRNEEIPSPSRLRPGQHLVSPDPSMALKAALYSALRSRGLTVADLAHRLGIDERSAAQLIDPRRAAKLENLTTALAVLGYGIGVEVHEKPLPDRAEAFSAR